eukprot:TRINITY_DN13175_c0_g3_i1.p2 TRINITY_DN13175_c0_g3~~TRINITY_DN13175_c0_g3_i1.p2  ORF type:complete len:193 (+),score=45.90 TRINITY_DN13175_c0_g3_i1:789-1367(+)
MLSPSLSPEYNKIKTKIRRLYDIANVLQALNLIEKTLLANHKPAFKWLGHPGFLTFVRSQRAKIQTDTNYVNEEKPQVFAFYCNPLRANNLVTVQPQVKHFKPRVLQLSSPFPLKSETRFPHVEGRRLKLEAEIGDKENAAGRSFSSLFGVSGAFNKLSMVPESMKGVGGATVEKTYPKHVLMESQAINLMT